MQPNSLSNVLQQRFVNSPPYAALLAATARRAERIDVYGLTESARSLVLSMLLQEIKRPMVLIAEDNHRAASYLQELSSLCAYPVYLFPASEVSPYEQVLTSADTMSGQLSALQHFLKTEEKVPGKHEAHKISPESTSALSTDKPCILIVPARALLQRVMGPEQLAAYTIRLKRGQKLDRAAFASQLVRTGYSRVSLVTLAGEFSVRGDIVDIYPSAGVPMRIELFDDEIESIRTFNIENQRSIAEEEEAEIPPRRWIVIDNPEQLVAKIQKVAYAAMSTMDGDRADTLRAVMNNDCAAIVAGQYPEAAEYYALYADAANASSASANVMSAGAVNSASVNTAVAGAANATGFSTLIDYLPDSALIVLDEWEGLSLTWNSIEEKFDAAMQEGLESGRLLPLPRPLHASSKEFLPRLMEHQRIYTAGMSDIELTAAGDSTIVQFNCHGVERFNNQIPQFIEKVRQYKHGGCQIVISTEQPQRVLEILAEWDVHGVYLAGSVDTAGSAGADTNYKSANAVDTNVSTSVNNSGANAYDAAQAGSSGTIWVTRHGFVGGFDLADTRLVSLTDAEIFGIKHKPAVYRRPVNEKPYESIASVADLKIGDYIVHTRQGIGQFVGVQRISMDNEQREYLTIQYAGDDKLYVPVDQVNMISRYRGAGDIAPRLSRMGGAEWESTRRRVKKSVRKIAEDLTNLYAMRARQEGFSCPPDTPWQFEMEEAFPYEETPDQWQSIIDVKKDLESTRPADRLICGDVGFGKTEVAIRAIFKVVTSGKQAAVLVPTTILAQQHFNTLRERFAPYPVRIGLLSRFRTTAEQRELSRRLALGQCDVVIGTHRLLQKDITFKDLGLVVIDEEQRFGVSHKEKLKQLRVMVDVITMSATPIPRTLHMALSGARDLSLINTPPANRMPIKTFVGEYKPALVRTAILHEIERGGQVYFVHNRVETIENIAHQLRQLIPEARIAIGHGQMAEGELENVMLDFSNHQMDVLLCTTIIESGLDIPNVNTIIIDDADRLGLAQLYQLRGRVGRSNVQAYAYCLVRPDRILSEVAQSRLKAIREFTSLGSGYQIALRDMEIRGVGNILGAEQHGHMVAVGYDLYVKLLEESVAEIKGEVVPEESTAAIDINITAYIPDHYIADSDQKIVEYKRLADVAGERELELLVDEWRDRFGVMPREVEQLVSIVRLRLIASKAGISAVRPDAVGLRLSVASDLRLQKWLPIQSRLPKHLAARTAYKPGMAGAHSTTNTGPYILVRCSELGPAEQVALLQELLTAMVTVSAVAK